MKKTEQFAWHASTALHLLVFVAICCCAPLALQTPLAQTRRGTIVLTATFAADMLAHQAPHLHLHAPGLPQDHQHEHLPLVVHSHSPAANTATMKRRIEPVVAEAEMVVTATEPPAMERQIRSTANADTPQLEASARSAAGRLVRRQHAASLAMINTAVSAANSEVGAHADELPRPLPTNPPPPYPPDAFAQRQQGRVLLTVSLDANGRPREVSVLESSGHRSLDDAARQAVSAWSFRPAYRNGEPVPFVIRVPVRFVMRQ